MAMSVLSLVCAFLITQTVEGHSTTKLAVSSKNTSPSVVSEHGPTSSPHLNTTESSSPVALVDELTMESLATYQASVLLKQILLPVTLVAGTFGNVVVVVIQYRLPASQKSSMSVHFTALAISDTIGLGTGWFWMFESFGVTLSAEYHVQRDFSDVFMDALCRVRVWTAFAFSEISAWILVSMTVHRVLGIVWPHRTRQFLTKSNAKKVVLSIVLFLSLGNAHLFYGHTLQPAGKGQTASCFFNFASERYSQFYRSVWVLVDVVVAVLLPFLCLLVTNTVLVRRVGQSLREARETLAEGRSDQFASRDKKLSSMTLTLIITSVAFFLLASPVTVFNLWEMTSGYATVNDVRLLATSELAVSVGVVMLYLNFAINFYLYCLTGARYRAEFVRLFGCCAAATRPQAEQSKSTVVTVVDTGTAT